ncbi:hypothetical protein CGW93_04910 [candidate division bacterium WOR-3 4484_18]|uniref:Uncharacterized protein n=1 Tax=candidate division WOR-3 bacterium 4484_18 TaxID=2020626 RepID=A0A257LUA8_UNCW3|nr:MAG: hypothetical protein CGW93_04910 [candidate division bacterium WOR-3 4484_18]
MRSLSVISTSIFILVILGSLNAQWTAELEIPTEPSPFVDDWRTAGVLSLTLTSTEEGEFNIKFVTWIKREATTVLTGESEELSVTAPFSQVYESPEVVDWPKAPEDGDTVSETPEFDWDELIVPAGYAINYKFVIAELEPGETESEAIASPDYEITVDHPPLAYPGDAPELEAGKSYVWQIQALHEGEPIGQNEGKSEIWQGYVGGGTYRDGSYWQGWGLTLRDSAIFTGSVHHVWYYLVALWSYRRWRYSQTYDIPIRQRLVQTNTGYQVLVSCTSYHSIAVRL